MFKRGVLLLCWLVSSVLGFAEDPVKGQFDLRTSWSEETGAQNLVGEWKFEWKGFLDPSKLATNAGTHEVPNSWSVYTGSNDIFPKNIGYCSYQTLIKLPKGPRWALKLPTIHSAYKLYVNAEEVHSKGVIDTVNGSKAQIKADILLIDPDPEGNVLLTLHVANSNFPSGGMWSPIKIGSLSQILSVQWRAMLFSYLIIGILLIMGFYHLGIYVYRRRDRSPLYFALICLAFAIREFLGPETLIWQIFPDFSYDLGLRLLYLMFAILLYVYIRFFDSIYPGQFKKWFINLVLVVAVANTIVVLFFPALVFARYNLITIPLMLFAQVWTIIILVRGMIKKVTGSGLFLFGVLVMMASGFNDMLNQVGVYDSGFVYPVGFSIFILCQSLVLAIRFSSAFDKVEDLNVRLEKVAVSQSRFVPMEFLQLMERTDITEAKLGDNKEMDMGILFADLRGFSSLVDGLSADETFKMVNDVLSRSAPLIRQNNGFIDKYIGDAIMALFKGNVNDMLTAALEIKRTINDADSAYRFGIGLHFGDMILGMVGEEERLEATVISDVVNTASRIEQLTKRYHVDILFTEAVYQEAMPIEHCRLIDITAVRGLSKPIKVFGLMDPQTEQGQSRINHVDAFNEALQLKLANHMDEAKKAFETYLQLVPGDKVAAYHLTDSV